MCRVDYGEWEGAWIVQPHLESSPDIVEECCECHRTIHAGEPRTAFEAASEADGDGEPILSTSDGREAFCQHCRAAATWLGKVCGGHLYGLNQINEDLQEHWDEGDPLIVSLNLGRLLVGQGHKWMSRGGVMYSTDQIATWAKNGAEHALAPAS